MFTNWCDDIKDCLSGSTGASSAATAVTTQGGGGGVNNNKEKMALETTGRIMELDLHGAGDLQVHYSDKLVTLLREVRQLSELGYRIPRAIASAAQLGEAFYRYGIKLKQVANFYNNMSDQIEESQKGMLVLEAREFERVVREKVFEKKNKNCLHSKIKDSKRLNVNTVLRAWV